MLLFVVLIDCNEVVESKKPTKVGCPCRMRHYKSFRPLTSSFNRVSWILQFSEVKEEVILNYQQF